MFDAWPEIAALKHNSDSDVCARVRETEGETEWKGKEHEAEEKIKELFAF